jgi:DNA modification methylase
MLFQEKITKLYEASQDKNHVQGLTHNFYRYPARFSPLFARTAIELFSKPGDIVLDPYMGGGTTIVEAAATGRKAIGVDLNSLACFIGRVKTTRLNDLEKKALLDWSGNVLPDIKYNQGIEPLYLDEKKIKNLHLPKARYLKKIIALILSTLKTLPSQKSQNFARCVILKTAQCALDGRISRTSTVEFREQLTKNLHEMLNELSDYQAVLLDNEISIYEKDASLIDTLPIFSRNKALVDLVVTSPPYPGLHVLYHRWQVDGRKETPAPYWITGTCDGQGDSFYNFGSRHQPGFQKYFDSSTQTLRAIRNVMRPWALIVQMIAFSNPEELLPRYLSNMEQLGFKEVLAEDRIWRNVPNRKWHAILRGNTHGSKEVVLIHRIL